MIMMRMFLPNDTRLVELISGGSLVLGAVMSFFTDQHIVPTDLLSYHIWQFWALLLGVLGVIQVGACAVTHFEHLRAATNWLVGGYWMWVGIHQMVVYQLDLTTIVSVLMGVSCFYAFVINLLLTRQAWKQ